MKWWKYVLAELAFWGFAFFGGMIPMLFNALQPAMSQYQPGDLGYIVLQFLSQAIGAGIAIWAINKITNERHPFLCALNCAIAGTAFFALAVLNLVYKDYWNVATLTLAIAVWVGGTIYMTSSICVCTCCI